MARVAVEDGSYDVFVLPDREPLRYQAAPCAAMRTGVDCCPIYSSLWAASGVNAGTQTAIYSAPSGPGVL